MTVHQTNDHPAAPQGNQCLFSYFLASLGAKEIAHNCTSMLWSIDSWKQGIRWPVSHGRAAGSSVNPLGSSIFWSFLLTKYQFQMIAFFHFFPWFIWNILCLCHHGPALWRFSFQTDLGRENSASFYKYRPGRPFLTMVKHWSCSMSNFYALIGQNLTCEFMWTIYAASWKLFTLTAEVVVFFHWMYKIKYSCYQESSVIHGWFVYWVFGWEMHRLSKFGNPISDSIVFIFHLA